MHRDLNCPSASSINQSINQSIISYSIPAHYHGRSFNHHPSWLIPWSFIIHPSIRLSSAQPTLPRVVSGSLRRHFLGAFGSCAGLWWAVFPSGVSVSTAARSDALAVAHLPLGLLRLVITNPLAQHTSISRSSIHGIDIGANRTGPTSNCRLLRQHSRPPFPRLLILLLMAITASGFCLTNGNCCIAI
ncbi:hypothetical protein B0T09DRAFT_139584 [Sordaria sp. MPI-SDFR-AT-0083]|nr:hypothetical protein B0T09DRAFT_139584 [Sordaria sp. MPI-SDFR-AT-0083]